MAQNPEDVSLDVLKEENRQLARDLKITEKLLETYRKCLLIFNTNCCCDKNLQNKTKLEFLEQFYDKHIGSKAKNEPQTDPEVKKSADILPETDQLFSYASEEVLTYIKSKTKDLTTDNSEYDQNSEDDNSYFSSDDNSLEDLLQNSMSKNGEQQKFICRSETCGKSFDEKYRLKRHIQSCHTFERPYECQNCDKCFSRTDHLVRHVKKVHKNYKKFVCAHEDCDFETIFEDKYKSHETRHQFVCTDCQKIFLSETDLIVHKESDHKPVPKVKKTPKLGPKSSKTSVVVKTEPLDEGYDRKTEVEGTDADDSAQVSKSKPKKKRKLMTGFEIQSKIRKYNSRQEIICPEVGCGKLFKCTQNLRKHTKTVHLNLRPFPCDWPGCESAFKTREAMTNHKSIHSNERNFKCEFEGCHKSFKIRCKLTQHMKVHGLGPKNERFPCSWPACGQYCASEQALTEHLNRHQNIRPFVCQFTGCDKSYFTSFELRQHSMKFHEQSESFRCDFRDCSMSFLNKRDLAKHRRLHIDVAKFVCSWPECCHTFNTSRDLSDHMNRHMDIKANKCLFLGCDRSYFTKKDLMRHIKQSHS